MSKNEEINREMQILHFNYRNLVQIPQEVIDNGKDILEIYLKRNCLASLPIDIGKFTRLKHLYVNGNFLQYLPKEIGDLTFLETLDLSQNELIEIPVEIGLLKFLENLNLSQNKIAQLPIELKNLGHLRILNLSSNKLTYFPEEIIELNHDFPTLGQSIQELIFDGNPLQYIPRSVGFLPKLKYLSMCKCNLLFLPGNLQSRDQNSPVLFDGNPLNYLPASILSPDIESFGCSTNAYPKLTNEISSCWPAISINFNGHYQTLYFDQYLYKIINPNNENLQAEDQYLSLVEISLRSLHKMKKLQKHDLDQLPKNITRFLKIGPLSSCYQCQGYIFTSCCPLFFTSDRLGQNSSRRRRNGSEIKIFCQYFCCTNCYYRFKDDLNTIVNFDPIPPNVKDMLRNEIFDWRIIKG